MNQDLEKTKRLLAQVMDKVKMVHAGNGNYAVITFEKIGHMTDAAALIDGVWFPLSVMAHNQEGQLLARRWFLEKKGKLL
jgi:hypothetical protein